MSLILLLSGVRVPMLFRSVKLCAEDTLSFQPPNQCHPMENSMTVTHESRALTDGVEYGCTIP